MLCCQGLEVKLTTTSPLDALPMKTSGPCKIQGSIQPQVGQQLIPNVSKCNIVRKTDERE